MLRQSVLRLSRAVARPAVARSFVTVARPQLKVAPVSFVRHYSSAHVLTKDMIQERIVALLESFDKVNDAKNITATANLTSDLGLDSLDVVEVVMAIEEEFGLEIPDHDADEIKTVQQAIDYVSAQPAGEYN
ncbi:Acyl carrier protein [Yarrowia sp. B02]|nr:Acyl carrier protein [Yarrowia sp. B02]